MIDGDDFILLFPAIPEGTTTSVQIKKGGSDNYDWNFGITRENISDLQDECFGDQSLFWIFNYDCQIPYFKGNCKD